MSVDRGADRAGRSRPDRVLLVVCAVAVLLPFFLAASPSDGRLYVLGHALPPSCPSREWLGVPCPGCGLGRSFVHLTHGRFAEAVRLHRVGPLVYLFLLGQAGFHVWTLHRRRRGLPPRFARAGDALAWGLAGALLANWAVGLPSGNGNGWPTHSRDVPGHMRSSA